MKTSRPLTGSCADSVPTSSPGVQLRHRVDAVGHDDESSAVADALAQQPRRRVRGGDEHVGRQPRARARRRRAGPSGPGSPARYGSGRPCSVCTRSAPCDGPSRIHSPRAAVVGVDHVRAARRSGARAPRPPSRPASAAGSPPPARRRRRSAPRPRSLHATAEHLDAERDQVARQQHRVLDRPAVRDRRDERDLHAALRLGGLEPQHRGDPGQQPQRDRDLHREEVRGHDRDHERGLGGGDDPQPVDVVLAL